MKILGDAAGSLGGYIPPWIYTHGYEEVRNYRTLFIQSIVENGWWGGCAPALDILINVCLLVLWPLFFEKFAGALHGQKHKYGMGAPHRAS